jgi:hypothetical protein
MDIKGKADYSVPLFAMHKERPWCRRPAACPFVPGQRKNMSVGARLNLAAPNSHLKKNMEEMPMKHLLKLSAAAPFCALLLLAGCVYPYDYHDNGYREGYYHHGYYHDDYDHNRPGNWHDQRGDWDGHDHDNHDDYHHDE